MPRSRILSDVSNPDPSPTFRCGGWFVTTMCLCSFAMLLLARDARGEAPQDEARRLVSGGMSNLDTDRSKTLSLTEFLKRDGDEAVLKRDFKLYDFSGDGTLSTREFGAVAGITPPAYRNSIPDPWDQLLRDAVAAMDESYDHWNHRPTDTVSSRTFIQNFYRSVADDARIAITGNLLMQVDRNLKGFLHRKDVRLFLEKQLGIRAPGGELLRESTGRTKSYASWIQLDQDRSNSISRREFERNRANQETTKTDFDVVDINKDSKISTEEFLDRNSPHHDDPVVWFRDADSNLDALINSEELTTASPESKRRLLSSTIPAFDQNGDDKLSLQEYLLSMHACSNLDWGQKRTDKNRDGKLAFGEFSSGEQAHFLLQYRFFFHRLDRDQTGWLSTDEFDFESNTDQK